MGKDSPGQDEQQDGCKKCTDSLEQHRNCSFLLVGWLAGSLVVIHLTPRKKRSILWQSAGSTHLELRGKERFGFGTWVGSCGTKEREIYYDDRKLR